MPGVAPCAARLPACIEQVVRELGGRFERTPHSVTCNVDADAAQVRNYLGTYLPRTVHEFLTIGQELLALPDVARSVPRQRPVRVLDLGSGTGGAWMGLAYALRRTLGVHRVNVVACDGNTHALAVQGAFAKAIARDTAMEIGLVRHQARLGLSQTAFRRTLADALDKIEGQFDFILISKHLSEFYQAQGKAAQPLIGAALDLLSSRLTSTGYLMLLDVTQKTGEGTEFFPVQMARELAQYLQDRPQGLRPILPVPCALHMRNACVGSTTCFTQRELGVPLTDAYSGAVKRVATKVSYRVLTPALHAQRISAGFRRDVGYRVNAQTQNRACVGGNITNWASGLDGFVPLYALSR